MEKHIHEMAAVDREDVREVFGRYRPYQGGGSPALKVVHAHVHPDRTDLTNIAFRQQIADISSARPHSALKSHHVTDTGRFGTRKQILCIGDVRGQRPFAVNVFARCDVSGLVSEHVRVLFCEIRKRPRLAADN
jgi:hypothetical protein